MKTKKDANELSGSKRTPRDTLWFWTWCHPKNWENWKEFLRNYRTPLKKRSFLASPIIQCHFMFLDFLSSKRPGKLNRMWTNYLSHRGSGNVKYYQHSQTVYVLTLDAIQNSMKTNMDANELPGSTGTPRDTLWFWTWCHPKNWENRKQC